MGQTEYSDRATTGVSAGNIIFKKGQPALFAAIVLKGHVHVRTPYGGFQLQAGDVVALFDIYAGTYLFDYSAKDDVQICPIYFKDAEAVRDALDDDKKYIPFTIISAAGQIKSLFSIYDTLYQMVKGVYTRMKISYEKYKNYAKKFAVTVPMLPELESLSSDFDEYMIPLEMKKCAAELMALSFESVSSLFGKAPTLAELLIGEESRMAIAADNANRNLLEYVKKELLLLSDRGEKNLFAGYHSMTMQIKQAQCDYSFALKEVDALLEEIHEMVTVLDEDLGIWVDPEWERLMDMRKTLGDTEVKVEDASVLYHYSAKESDNAISSLQNVTEQILKFADYTPEQTEDFQGVMTAYRLQKKQNFTGEDSREVIRAFEQKYYELYEVTFIATEEKKEAVPPAVSMFLDYGLLSEKDFTEADLIKFYHAVAAPKQQFDFGIHTMSEWLHLIYSGEREPSRNEFDEDFRESLAHLKRQQSMTPQEEKDYLNNPVLKIRYEIQNMLRVNNRMIYASNGAFCPFVFGEEFPKDINSQIMDWRTLSSELMKIKDIDYSIFYRETMYQDAANKGEHFRIMVETLPDLILLPNVGSRGSMWQEIEGRKRVSPARFILPMYPMIPLQDLLLPLLGKYRWEFCRTEQGVRWNDVSEKSLTSEFYDYVQYYKKNADLSDTAKVKMKERMSQHRNNISEIFIGDYVSWIKFEAQGASRLNKVSRELLSRYCPFAKEIRTPLSGNPMFGDLITRYEMKEEKKAKEISMHYQNMQKKGIEITEELEKHLEFYKK